MHADLHTQHSEAKGKSGLNQNKTYSRAESSIRRQNHASFVQQRSGHPCIKPMKTTSTSQTLLGQADCFGHFLHSPASIGAKYSSSTGYKYFGITF